MTDVSDIKEEGKHHHSNIYRRYYLPDDVESHCMMEDCWVSVHGSVLDISDLIMANRGDPLARPLIVHAGQDISHWFTKQPIHPVQYIDIERGARCFYLPHGRYLHMPPDYPGEFTYNFETPWWMDEKYIIGKLTKKSRKIRIINTLTHHEDTLLVPSEETLFEIQTRYLDTNKHSKSYTWKDCYSRVLVMDKTLEDNKIVDEDGDYDYLDVPDSQRLIPSIMLYFNDDLTDL